MVTRPNALAANVTAAPNGDSLAGVSKDVKEASAINAMSEADWHTSAVSESVAGNVLELP